jgi:hypothetical protein
MAIIKSYSPFLNLSNFSTFIVDTNPNSDYFRINEFKEVFSGGKNGFLIAGSEFLKETTEVKIEILDVAGNPIYFEPGDGTPEYYEGLSTLVSVHVYPDTPIGLGKITILGELKNYVNQDGTILPIPEEWKGVYNVKWERTFNINRNLANEDIVRFYRRPSVSITELVKPIFSKTIPSITQSGSVVGIATQPIENANLTNWTAGTLYKLRITDGPDWTSSIDNNIVSIPSLGYSPTVVEVLNNKEVLVDIPYSQNNIVKNFTTSSYTSSFEYVEGQTINTSILTGSFAKINISNLKTFVGDVARVKVFRKSRNEVSDFQFVQESKLESSELLRDITITDDTEVSYGNFTQTNLDTYWTSSNSNHPLSINVDVLQSSVKCDYNTSTGGVQNLITTESFAISKDVEYTLTFKTLLSGSIDGSEYIKAYFSSSDGYQQTFLTVSGSSTYKTRQNVSQNIIASPISTSDAKLVFEIKGSDWYISNVSLKNAQETSFSPDEFILIQDIPRKLATETFDFRFEFYDINNNYIPVDVTATGIFDGGNEYPTNTKILLLEGDRSSFRFTTGSIGNPPFQQIGFTTTRQNIVDDVTYDRSVFDITGSYISEAQYLALGGTEYPGRLHTSSSAGFVVQIDEFTGSLDTATSNLFRVGFIVYTASADGLQEYETIYRLEDGDNAPGIFASSTSNQFIYKATDLSLNPIGQIISFDVRRKNLGTSGAPITINSISQTGSSYPLTLLFDDPTTGVATYYLSGSDYKFTSGSTTFFFSASDNYGIDYHDQITITPIKILDGLSVTLTNENATLPAKSNGFVESGSFIFTSGSVSVKVGNETILFDDEGDGQANNTFAITSVNGTTGITVNSSNPTTNDYGISALNGVDSGSINVVVRYKDGSGDTTNVTKVVTYSKVKRSAPNVLVTATPQSQVVNATSQSIQTGTFSIVALEALEGSTSVFASASLNYSNFTGTSITAKNLTLGTIPSGSLASSASVQIFYNDSEGTYASQSVVVSGTKSVAGIVGQNGSNGTNGTNGTNGANGVVINITPTSQTVNVSTAGVYASPVPFTIQVIENGTPLTHTTGSLSNSTFSFGNITNGTSGSLFTTSPTITPTTPSSTSGLITTFTITYKTSAGVQSSALPQSHSVSVTLDGVTGPGVVHTGVWEIGRAYQFESGLLTGTGRRDTVLWSSTGNPPYDTYYASTRQHTSTNNSNSLTGRPDLGGPWVSLGTQDFFVAAKIAVFEDSYIQNTLNVGTSNNGGISSANITLNGSDAYPYFSLGQSATVGTQEYGANGIFIGRHDSTKNTDATNGKYVMSLVNGTTSYIKWNGDSLDIKGSITVTGGDAATNSNLSSSLQNAVTSGSVSASAAQTAAQLFAQTAANNAIATGSISASAAQTNAVIQANTNALNFASASVNMLANGGWIGGSGTFITATSISSPLIAGNGGYISGLFRVGQNGITLDGINKKIYVGAGNYYNSDTPFYFASGSSNVFSLGNKLGFDGNNLTITGNITANTGSFSGTVNAAGGTFSGNITATGTITGGTISGATLSGATGTFTGTITSTAGFIGGWQIGNSQINDTNNKMKLVSTRPALEIYTGNDLAVDISAATSLTSIVSANATTSGVPYTTTTQVLVQSFQQSTLAEANQIDSGQDPLVSSGGTHITFVPSATNTFNAVITLGGTHSSAIGILEPTGLPSPAVFQYLYASYTVGVSIRQGSVGGTEVANLSAFVNWNRVGSGNSNLNEASTPGTVLTGNITLTGGVTYYIVPYIQSGIVQTQISSGNFATLDLRATYRTPTVTAVNISKGISKTELIAGGFQVVFSDQRYFIVERLNNADFVRIGGGLTCTGDVTANTSSDKRWKDNIIPIENPIEKIKKISGNSFVWKEGYDGYHTNKGLDYGVIAQEIEEVMPEIVVEREGGFKGVRYEKIIPLLIEAIKDQQKQIDEIKRNR